MRIKSQEIIALKKKLKKNRIKGLALDVDETLSFTIGYMVDELTRKIGNPENLTAREIFLKYRVTQNVPCWQNDKSEKIVDEIINSDNLQKDLPLIENANQVVSEVNKIVPIVAYITARPSCIRNGTEFWLKKHGFVKAAIILRPKSIDKRKGNIWKTKVLKYLYPEVQGIVDDNPNLVRRFRHKYKGKVFLYEHLDFEETKVNVIPCKNWPEVLEKVKNKFNDDRD
jgi:hypothetical protein